MKLHDCKHWTDKENTRGLMYFAQRFDELTWAYTLDSYRAPTTNAPFLVRECLRFLDLYHRLGKSPKSVEHILEETRERFKENSIALSCLTLPIERYFNYEITEVQKAKKKLRVLSREISPTAYLAECAKALVNSVPNARKSEIEQAASEFATTLLNIGYSAQHLNDTCHDHFFNSENPVLSLTKLDEFIESLRPSPKKFSIFFDANTSIREIEKPFLQGFGVKEIRRFPKELVRRSEETGIDLFNPNHRIVAFSKLEEFDKYTALNSALSRLNWLHDIYGLFRHRNSVALSNEAMVFEIDAQSISKLRTDTNQMHRISDNRPDEANKRLEKMLTQLHLPSGPDRHRFFRVINFHGLSTRSTSEENQLINLWTALETITSSHISSSSIVDTVARDTVPIIGLNYLHRLVKSLTFDLIRWDRRKLTDALNKCVFPENADLIKKVFCFVAAEENDGVKEDFLAELTDFELLRYRIFSVNKFLRSGKKALDRVEKHERFVSWQIYRIYRARNEIVHSSTTGSNTDSLIVSAHDYFDQVFEVTAQLASGESGFRTYSECFDYCNDRYSVYKAAIKKLERIKIADVDDMLWQPKPILRANLLFDDILDS